MSHTPSSLSSQDRQHHFQQHQDHHRPCAISNTHNNVSPISDILHLDRSGDHHKILGVPKLQNINLNNSSSSTEPSVPEPF